MPAEKVEAIGNGVVISDFANIAEPAIQSWRERLELPRDSVVIGTVGRLVAEKGYREFFYAASRVAASNPSVRVLVVGDVLTGDRDPFSATVVEMLASDQNLRDKVRFSGFTEDVPPLMQLIDVFVLASYREGMPRSIIEAMAAGKPVVASDIRGCREEVVDGVTGFLVPVRNVPALASRLDLLVKDSKLRRELGLAGCLRAQQLFDEADVIKRLTARIDTLLAERHLS
jgi:glycosyltransferase involved in cell wall biosynthesis